jgi:hypothetical protein
MTTTIEADVRRGQPLNAPVREHHAPTRTVADVATDRRRAVVRTRPSAFGRSRGVTRVTPGWRFRAFEDCGVHCLVMSEQSGAGDFCPARATQVFSITGCTPPRRAPPIAAARVDSNRGTADTAPRGTRGGVCTQVTLTRPGDGRRRSVRPSWSRRRSPGWSSR